MDVQCSQNKNTCVSLHEAECIIKDMLKVYCKRTNNNLKFLKSNIGVTIVNVDNDSLVGYRYVNIPKMHFKEMHFYSADEIQLLNVMLDTNVMFLIYKIGANDFEKFCPATIFGNTLEKAKINLDLIRNCR